jgi:DNA-binding NtrC family response regulator
VHVLSSRKKQPFIAVNCGAISPNLIDSEMFGHERGSFTGAEKMHRGYFEQADGGTLFLDEITEMPSDMQVSLLRVLETRSVMRVGTAIPIPTDVRIIAATNRDPAAAVKEGKLRADLYHRLNVFPLQVPPLRDRKEDIGLIAQAFVDELNADEGENRALSPETIHMLESHDWPGNVRELKNAVHRLFILDQLNATEPRLYEAQALAAAPSPVPAVVVPLGTTLAMADQQLIVSTLEYCGGDRKRTAEMLGICVKTLYNKLRARAV